MRLAMWNKYTHNPGRYGRMIKADALRDFRENIKHNPF